MNWLFRMRKWAQNPPSPGMVKLVLCLIVVLLAVYGLEKAGLLPDWFAAQKMRP